MEKYCRHCQKALEDSQKKYRLLADNIQDIIFVLDMDLNFTYISPSVKSIREFEVSEQMKSVYLERLISRFT